MKGTLHGVKVAPFFGGDLTDWIDILRGVKQGCPLSPLLFIIAYDPLLFKLSRMEGFSSYAFADDLALFGDSVSAISPALSLISVFSVVSGLGVNKDKSVAIPTAGPLKWPAIRLELASCPWKDLPLKESGTHLGILVGRQVTLEMLWKGPVGKALAKVQACKTLVRSFPLSLRIVFTNVFIVSFFSYIGLFFVLPTTIWKKVRAAVLTLFPFNGTAYPYEALVCGKQIFCIKPALRDVWAFNVSLLAVRSPLFSVTTNNYHSLPIIKLQYGEMRISKHRDAAAVDFWRSRHFPDGTLIPPRKRLR